MNEPEAADIEDKGQDKEKLSSTGKPAMPVGNQIAIALAVIFGIIFIYVAAIAYEMNSERIKKTPANEIVIYIASWILLLIISALSTFQLREIMQACAHNVFRKRANFIAIMIGLVLTIFLFKQPFLEQLFAGYTTSGIIKIILFAGGVGSGWLAWYLKHLRKYGEFFNVLLLTIIVGFCWYARLTAPEQIQLTAVAFLLGSLFHVAKDYLDKAIEVEMTKN
jgi:hypothetical protein